MEDIDKKIKIGVNRAINSLNETLIEQGKEYISLSQSEIDKLKLVLRKGATRSLEEGYEADWANAMWKVAVLEKLDKLV